jgi:6-pyruvoyltetrahydropterin/6-carboxytetrahydropterin synthase
MSRLTTVELYKENMKFSVAHFTIFSATERERLHGHNYTVYVALDTIVEDNGLTFDYRYYKEKARQLCRQLNQYVLIPAQSPYLTLDEDQNYLYAVFNDERIPFLPRDVKVLNVANITVEDLSLWFIEQLVADQAELDKNRIQKILVKVASGPGQTGSACWERQHG